MITQPNTSSTNRKEHDENQLNAQIIEHGKKSTRKEKEKKQYMISDLNDQLRLSEHQQKTTIDDQQSKILFKQDSTSISFQAMATNQLGQSEKKQKQNSQKKGLGATVLAKSRGNVNQNLKKIQEQKREVVQELKRLDEEILQIKNRNKSLSIQKKKQKERMQQQALKNAKSLVQHYKIQKKLDQQRKNQQRKKSLQKFKKQQQSYKNIYLVEAKQAIEQKRRVISLRIEEGKKKQEQRTLINNQRNRVVSKLIKQEEILKQKQRIPEYLAQLQQKRANLYERKEQINIKEIQEHQRRYIELKQLQRSQVVSRKSVSLSHPIPKFKKNVWAQRLQNEEFRKREEQKSKDLKKKINLQKRVKYSELVKNIFIPKRKQRLLTQGQTYKKRGTPQLFNHNNSINLPTISQSEKNINQTKMMKKFRENVKDKMDYSLQYAQQQSNRKQNTQKSQEKTEQERKKEERLIQLKKQTEERLKKIQQLKLQRILQSQKKQKSKYKNYLGSVKLKRKSNPKDWQKIIESTKLTNEQKYAQMMKRATLLEQHAKQNEYKQKEGKEISVQFYIHSIQAKLALLQKF